MAKKKTEEIQETVEAAVEPEVSGETPFKAEPPEKKTKKAAAKKTVQAKDETEDKSIAENVFETVAETLVSAVDTVAETVSAGVSALAEAVVGPTETKVHKGKRAEKIGIVASDKMTKTVTVRVDRLVKHPIYRKYVRKRKKFMAHDELGSKTGDKVRIVETRPLSARKRWRVVEIIQKAEL